jgi:spore photoproduct lyase
MFIPWVGQYPNVHLFMLTKSDQVSHILDLDHNGHTILAWSLNEPSVSREFEVGAPPFERRLDAARQAQSAGYPVRIRIDPIVPFDGWREAYANTIRDIFSVITPERVTLGTLRFEKGFVDQKNTIFVKKDQILPYINRMSPMLAPLEIKSGDKKKTSVGKYSFLESERIDIFNFAIAEVRRYSAAPIALCKESSSVWQAVGLNPTNNQCVCQH